MKKLLRALVLLVGTVLLTALAFGCKKECEHTHCEWVVVKEPACGATGKSQYVCQDCGVVVQVKYLPKISSHSYGEWASVSGEEITCGFCGEVIRTCAVCGAEQTFYLSKDHEWSEWASISTCCLKRTCTVCGEEDTDYIFEKHEWGDWASISACCLKRTCTVCGEEDTDYIFSKHEWGEWVDFGEETPCGFVGDKRRTCAVCGYVISDTFYPEHEWGDYVLVSGEETACGIDGYATRTCAVCGLKQTHYLYPDHEWGEWASISTCCSKRTCAVCGAEETNPFYAEHEWGDWVPVSGEKTACGIDGDATRTCALCGLERTYYFYAKHEWGDYVLVSGEETPCGFEGEWKHTCVVCGTEDTYFRYADHQWEWNELYPVEGAKCNTICTHYRKCTLCGEKHACQENHFLYHSYKDGFCIYCNQKEPEAAGQVIEFGAYPQTQVTDDATLTELNKLVLAVPGSGEGTVDGWSSYMVYLLGKALYTVWYQDVTWNSDKYRAVAFRSVEGGEAVDEAVCWYKWEPLKWTALENADDHIVLMCNSIIDAKAMNNGAYGTWAMADQNYYDWPFPSYAKSDLNAWLNSDFYNWAFSANEKIKVLKEEHSVFYYDWSTVDIEHYKEYVYILDGYTMSNPNYDEILTGLMEGLGTTDYANKLGCKTFVADNLPELTCWASNTSSGGYTDAIFAYQANETYSYEIARYVKLGVVPLIVISK